MTARKPSVTVYSDGACSGNPGPGGWGAILIFGEHRKELYGGEPLTTNNRMELIAAISALEGAEAPERRRPLHRQPVSAQRDHGLDPRLEEERLEDGRQEAGQERRAVAAARAPCARATTCASIGSRATPDTPRTSAPTSSRARA